MEHDLELIRALSRLTDHHEGQATAARAALAQTLYHVAGGQSRRWTVPAERRQLAAAEVVELSWHEGPGGELVVELTTRPQPEEVTP